MPDVVVTVPQRHWSDWLAEGDLPGQRWSGYRSHFWIAQDGLPRIKPGERVYVVAHGKLRGYAPLISLEPMCLLASSRACLMRADGAVACTLPETIRGFQGWRYRWWERAAEVPFPEWQEAGGR